MHRRGRGGHGYAGANDRSQVSKSFERILRARLEVFASSSENEMKLESLSREERKIVHGIAQKLGLQSRSAGREPNRTLFISRPMANATRVVSNICESDAIQLDPEQRNVLEGFLRTHPPTAAEIELHLSGHMKHNSKHNLPGISGQGEMLIPPAARPSVDVEKFRRSLPTYAHREEILTTIKNHKVTLITGGTGCGKTTQVPQFLLEDAMSNGKKLRIVVTQPRRLPAIAVAERVAKERGERLGSTVGYHIRLEQRVSKETVLTYCTSGVLLRMLTMDANASDISHIILDEIHEREQNTDYLLIALKQALKHRKNLKVILMSATMEGNINMFLNYFDGVKVGHVDVPSRLFDVEKFYLADVLALTAYTPPTSGFGGMFSDIFPGFGNNKRFPRIDHFEEPNTMTTVRTEPNLTDMHSFGASSSPSPFGGFGENRMRYQQAMQSASTSALNCQPGVTDLPKRPKSFSAEYVRTLRTVRLDECTLIDNYMNGGGQQWSEGIDPDLTVAAIRYCMDSSIAGAVLVFLPGYEDILSVRDKVMKEMDGCRTKPEVFTLHSQMNSADQQRVFEQVHYNKRKVILSTNIAEASLTIDDVVFVIDCGKVKEKSYDHHSRISQLNVTWIAKSNAEQRSGRAGRCRPGFCFRLYSREEHEGMLIAQVAEMKRSAIHEVCLHAKMFAPEDIAVKDFLEMAPEPPHRDAVHQSMQFLEVLGALSGVPASETNDAGQPQSEPLLTELGRHLAHLPLDPQLARLLLFGIALKCCYPIVTLVASLAHRDPFVLPLGDERNSALSARDDFSHCDFSDHITLIRAFYAYNQCPSSNNRQVTFCRSKFLSPNTMKMIHGITRQLLYELRRLGMIGREMMLDDPELNRYSNCWPMIQAAIVAGCYPGIGLVRPGTKLRKIRTSVISNSATLHPGCVIKRQLGPSRRSEKFTSYITGTGEEPKMEYLAYQELSKIDEGVTIRTVTAVPPLSVFFFAGSVKMSPADIKTFELDVHGQNGSNAEEAEDIFARRNVFLSLGDDLTVRGPFNDFRTLMHMRAKIMAYFMEVMRNPSTDESKEDKELLECLAKLLMRDHKRCGFYDCEDLPEPKVLRNKEVPPPLPPAVIPKINYGDDDEANDVVSGDSASRMNTVLNNTRYGFDGARQREPHQHRGAAREAHINATKANFDFEKVYERQIEEWGPGVSLASIPPVPPRRPRPKKYNDHGGSQLKRVVHTVAPVSPIVPINHQVQNSDPGKANIQTENHKYAAPDSDYDKANKRQVDDWGQGGNWFGGSSSRNAKPRVYNNGCYDNNNYARRHQPEPTGGAAQSYSASRDSGRYQRKKSGRGGQSYGRSYYGNNAERRNNEHSSYSGGPNRFGNSYGQQCPNR
ncbi:hypothetical protein QR680_009318 [Steinernema hermaphroditum]|uniref:RNA helicase n=1 Tax=Steinernema hermaphroditum TaxID=289476 RepID=A0AA39IJV6_9BILA|nr:hypothetical protein QR680_009318 [Steinernema hermaphroditum]